VGGFSIAILSALGYEVVASTGRIEEAPYLHALGATQIIDRAELEGPAKPLGQQRWAGVIDNAGSRTLANVCATLKSRRAVAACGMAQGGGDFPGTVAPFIVRGVTLIGIDSVLCPMPDRLIAWARLSEVLRPEHLKLIASQSHPLADALGVARELVDGSVRGRIRIDVDSSASSS
jgi:acrylyl-CoA reductase (NADPH)